MSDAKKPITDPDFERIEPALRRAAKKARELSIRMNAPFYVFRDGKIVDLNSLEPNPIPKGE